MNVAVSVALGMSGWAVWMTSCWIRARRSRRRLSENLVKRVFALECECGYRALAHVASGGKIAVPFHLFGVRDIVRTISEEHREVFDRNPDFAWRLRAMDDYLTAVGQALGELDDRGRPRQGPYIARDGTYEPLSKHLAEADI